ncbi:hypothetical protein [Vibrio caribbeanicus]|uniref:Chromosome segregation ATPase n=1 Tax=Vibrio caribbeanicus ATCC BAA-2122 TaxID=796620 RepID=E3BKE7_9VIBR|nr:hypothetical protein [Vibrio caribbeanicus]EFP96532.1 hypothetical protein VIBC2010_05129 [Vibrio caribbeanicus ATCC BAA-2122]
MRPTLKPLALLFLSFSSIAVPSYQQCSGNQSAANNILFDRDCSTAYVGLPDKGKVVLDSYSSFYTEDFCEEYEQLREQNVLVKSQINTVFHAKLDWINTLFENGKEILTKKSEISELNTQSEIFSQKIDVLREVIADYRRRINTLTELISTCPDEAQCDQLTEQLTETKRNYFANRRESRALSENVDQISMKTARVYQEIESLQSRVDNMEIRINELDKGLRELDDLVYDRMYKYLNIYGSTAKLLFSLNMDEYIQDRKRRFGSVAETYNWKPMLFKNVRLWLNVSEPSEREEYQVTWSPVIDIVTPEFSSFGKEFISGNPESSQNPILTPQDIHTQNLESYLENSKAMPTSFASLVNFNLHGACLLKGRNLGEHILPYVSATLSAEYDVKGFASYHAVVNQHSILEFLREIKSRGFLGFGSVKTKIRKTESHQRLVNITLNADSYAGKEITNRYKRLLSTGILERASIAILDSIATRRRGPNHWLPDLDEEGSEMKNELVALGPRLNMTSMMCRSAGRVFCDNGWEIGKFSFSNNSYRYKSETKAHYEESISDVYFQTFSNSMAFENVPNQ